MNDPRIDNPCAQCDPKCAAFAQDGDVKPDCPTTRNPSQPNANRGSVEQQNGDGKRRDEKCVKPLVLS